MKLKVLVLDNDKVFLSRLKRAFDEFYREEMEWVDIEGLGLQNINKSHCDVLLVDKFYDGLNFVSSGELTVIFLTTDLNEVNDYCIFKYSRAKEIYKNLNERYKRYTPNPISAEEDLYLDLDAISEIQNSIRDLQEDSNMMAESDPTGDLCADSNLGIEAIPVNELYLDSEPLSESEPMVDLYLEPNTMPGIELLPEPYLDSNIVPEYETTQKECTTSSDFAMFNTGDIEFNGTVCKLFMSLSKAGATSVAIAKVGNLLEQGYKVLYLNLETVPSTEKFFKYSDFEKGKRLSEFSYENLVDYLSSMIVCRNNSLYYFFPFEGQASELISTVNGIRLLLDTLLKMNLFDYIIMDFTTRLDERLKLLYQYCESITLVTKGDFITEPEYRQVENWLIGNSLFDKCRCLFSQLISENTFDTKMSVIGAIPNFYEEEGMRLVNKILTLGIINRI